MKAAKKVIYLDNAASTPIDKKVALAMAKAIELYGNPSSYNDCGRHAREYIEQVRLKVGRFLGARPDEVVFTASGTESNNLAVFGLTNSARKGEIISTPIEHPSVLKPLEFLGQKGRKIKFVKVNKDGLVDLNDIRAKLNRNTVLVSIMYANNEIGTIQPIAKIGKIISDFRDSLPISRFARFPALHVDACQATEYLDMNVNRLGVDMLTLNGSKIHGPKGAGVLYVRRGVKLSPFVTGGEQEFGLRAGTENLSAIGGLAVALEQIKSNQRERLSRLREYFLKRITELITELKINGAVGGNRLPNNMNISVPGLTSEILLLELDKYGICAGSGSACTSHSVEPSHVLKAIGVEKKYLDGAVRFSMGRQTTKKDIDFVLKVLPKVVKDLKRRYGV